jgi:hypothetical protein
MHTPLFNNWNDFGNLGVHVRKQLLGIAVCMCKGMKTMVQYTRIKVQRRKQMLMKIKAMKI